MKKRKKMVAVLITLFALLLLSAGLILTKKINLNQFVAKTYDLRGVDVSNYQGDIDWTRLASQDIDFAFIKATEGSSHLDPRFKTNWQAASQTDLAVGAYHFFSFDSPGSTQAWWFMENIGDLSQKLIPVVDVEYYGDKVLNPPDQSQVTINLKDFLAILEECYGKKPIIYTTYKVYHRFIKDEFKDYPLWIRNVYYSPNIDLQGEWQFWQYMDTAILEGYVGKERYIDLNVFYGTKEEFKEYIIP